MRELITQKEGELSYLSNDLTKEMDTYLKEESSKYRFDTYIYGKSKNRWIIRYPGATRGHIEVDDNDVIINIKLYDDEYHTDDIYRPDVRECFSKYIGMKVVKI